MDAFLPGLKLNSVNPNTQYQINHQKHGDQEDV